MRYQAPPNPKKRSIREFRKFSYLMEGSFFFFGNFEKNPGQQYEQYTDFGGTSRILSHIAKANK
jgi:hypothetical protein